MSNNSGNNKNTNNSNDNSPTTTTTTRNPSFCILNTFSYDKIKANAPKISGKTKEEIQQFDIVLLPIHHPPNTPSGYSGVGHWTLVVIRNNQRKIEHFDSIPQRDHFSLAVCDEIENWITSPQANNNNSNSSNRTSNTLLPGSIDISPWQRDFHPEGPHQDNESDCGVFVCKIAEELFKGNKPPFVFPAIDQIREGIQGTLWALSIQNNIFRKTMEEVCIIPLSYC